MKVFKTKKKRIYMDYAAATPVRKEVKKAMDRFWDVDFGNPGGIHQEGVIARKAITESREKIAEILKARPNEIIFNSGGTESNNSAIFGVLDKLEEQGMDIKDMHLITTVMEHPSVLSYFKYFEKKGAQLDLLNIDENGIVDLKEFRKLLKPNTVLISIVFVNNEIGTIQPINEIVKIIRNFKKIQLKNHNSVLPILHSDAAQALLYIPIDMRNLRVDLMSFDSQKIYGPKGLGILYVRKGIEINPLISGGNQERGLRSGTENVPLIIGFAKALELAKEEQEKEVKRLTGLRDYFIKEVLENISGAELNGDTVRRLANNVNISIPASGNEFSVIQLDNKGIACSPKTACSKSRYSYIVESLGKSEEIVKNSIRFSLGKLTTKKDIDYVVKVLMEVVNNKI
ncbi:MAG: cysteine desulfurase [Candidatus Pacebacteria bacterium]|nr:cysteine desulfurase [Candidatus Paceibacterota bacterium]